MNDPMQPSLWGKAETQTWVPGPASSPGAQRADWGAGGKTPVKGGWDRGPGSAVP